MGDPGTSDSVIHVAAGLIGNGRGEYLLSRRRPGTHLAGAWEFPGGKIDPGESPVSGLARELHEELGVSVETAEPLLSVTHAYPEKTVRLHLFDVTGWRGEPDGREGQRLDWRSPAAMAELDMPAADRPICRVLGLDSGYAITPDLDDVDALRRAWGGLLDAGRRLLQFRAPRLPDTTRLALARECGDLARARGAIWLYNGPVVEARQVGADGVHFNARRLMSGVGERGPAPMLAAASCHNRAELVAAGRRGMDFVTLSPVRATPGHPGSRILDWHGLAELVADSPVPVYALGGVDPENLDDARRVWAWGVAGIRGFAGA